MSGSDVIATLVDHQRSRTDIRWDSDELDWIHWYRCSCGHEERSDQAVPLWWEEHVAELLVPTSAMDAAALDRIRSRLEAGLPIGPSDALWLLDRAAQHGDCDHAPRVVTPEPVAAPVTYCRIFRAGPACPHPCADCKRTNALLTDDERTRLTVPDERNDR